jgi:guanyl-specific ribonuclease Sa
MKLNKLYSLLAALLFANFAHAAEKAPAAYDLLSGLVPEYSQPVLVSTPTYVEFNKEWEKPPCVPTQNLAPGRGFTPVVYDPIRVRAINELLQKISVCTPLPYKNDGVIHSTPRPGLPKKPYGYYLEFTLIIPGRETGEGPEQVQIGNNTYMTGSVLSHRGPERLMIGDRREVYYTPDHYKTHILLNITR